MRNWNKQYQIQFSTRLTGIYLTYEELKPFLLDLQCADLLGFILPMRNWNLIPSSMPISGIRDLSYLWGIETCHRSLPCPQELRGFILPMRNWNNCHAEYGGLLVQWDLSYLWGIETHAPLGSRYFARIGFILPMRNWNLYKLLVRLLVNRDLSYLWGIETLPRRAKLPSLSKDLSYLWGIET